MAKTVSKGTALKLSISSVFTAVGGLTKIDGPGPDVGTYDATALDTSGSGREKKPTGFVDGGVVSASGFFDPDDSMTFALNGKITTPVVSEWRIDWSDGEQWPFDGVLKKFKPVAELDQGLKHDLEIELDGLPDYPTS